MSTALSLCAETTETAPAPSCRICDLLHLSPGAPVLVPSCGEAAHALCARCLQMALKQKRAIVLTDDGCLACQRLCFDATRHDDGLYVQTAPSFCGGGFNVEVLLSTLDDEADKQRVCEADKRRVPKCSSCGTAGSATLKLKKCTGCRTVQYCGRDCQRKSWPGHKDKCRRHKEAAKLDTRVIEALLKSDTASAKALMAAGAAVDTIDAYGETALLGAVASNRADWVKLLLEYGAGTCLPHAPRAIPLTLSPPP